MIFRFLFINLILLFPFQVNAQETLDDAPIRGFIWGLPADIIQENERGRFVDEEVFDDQNKALFFVDRIRGMRVSIAYEFMNDRLWQARIFIDKNYFDPQDRMEDLLTIHTDLTNRFGPPDDEEMSWINPREKNFPDAWGWAVFRQELIMTSTWRNEETMVQTYLGAKEKYNPIMSVTYTYLPTKLEIDKTQQKQEFWAP